jgi:hypothetical protein
MKGSLDATIPQELYFWERSREWPEVQIPLCFIKKIGI